VTGESWYYRRNDMGKIGEEAVCLSYGHLLSGTLMKQLNSRKKVNGRQEEPKSSMDRKV